MPREAWKVNRTDRRLAREHAEDPAAGGLDLQVLCARIVRSLQIRKRLASVHREELAVQRLIADRLLHDICPGTCEFFVARVDEEIDFV